ncbi:MAG: signal peptidase I, partial [Acidimicrobiales bacterium]
TTGNMQLYSIIVTSDDEMKEKLSPCHFNQGMVKEAPVTLTFCADFNRFKALIGTGLKTYVGEPYKVPSGSMLPTIEPGDWIVANKMADDLDDFHYGDLVVFLPPPPVDDQVDALVKRIIGLPGDEITFADGVVVRNGAPVDEPYLTPGTVTTPKGTEPVIVPEGAFFVLGDNRSSSIDSRIYGSVAGENIIGRASLRFWPLTDAGGL